MNRRIKILIAALVAFAVLAGATVLVCLDLQKKITQRLARGAVLPPLELYSQGFVLSPGRQFPLESVQKELARRDLRPERDYLLASARDCANATGLTVSDNSQNCLWLKTSPTGPVVITWDAQGWVQNIWAGQPFAERQSYSLFPRLITEFYDGKPILQKHTPLSEIPLVCLEATTAIEDHEFLEHRGVSPSGILRAMLRNLKAGRWAEGGSTITQQLVKNFFLTSRKTLSRKIEEQFLALLLEAQLNKDKILEMYLNVIYMGQAGPYQVRGFGSAAAHYFETPISQLNLPQCALLAALINSPGRYSPFEHPNNALARRQLVLRKMREFHMISEKEYAKADAYPLPQFNENEQQPSAPYFVIAALKEFSTLGLETEEGARLYTTLDPELQEMTVKSVRSMLPKIEARIRHPSKQPLQTALVTVDLDNAQVLAMVGGRSYRTTQYNRATDSRRQIGSVVKPFVYWPAMKDHTPLTSILDRDFSWKFGKQIWTPKNYEQESFGLVPYFFALANSLNVPAARIGQMVGLDQVINTLHLCGIHVPIAAHPALTLGALELSPMEVAQAYFTLARFGSTDYLHTLARVEDHNGRVLFTPALADNQVLNPAQTAVLVGMMRQTIELGTARASRAAGLTGEFAGKTGTTSDTKDAWFSGFNSRLLTVVWVGYDDNTALGLTGSSGALPIWLHLNLAAEKLWQPRPFQWPAGVHEQNVERETLLQDFPTLRHLPETIQLIFAN